MQTLHLCLEREQQLLLVGVLNILPSHVADLLYLQYYLNIIITLISLVK